MPTENTRIRMCDKHHSPMTEMIGTYTDTTFKTPAFQCAESGCTRVFTSGRGYFDNIGGSPLADKTQQRCPGCNTAMYLGSLEPEAEVWRCPLDGCGREQRMVA